MTEQDIQKWNDFVEALNTFFNETLPAILKPIIDLLKALAPYARHWKTREHIKRNVYQRRLQLAIISLSNQRLQLET